MAERKIPVTVLTGFLGSGKTTLLNHILTAQHGKRIAVIENEFGEVGVDQELVIQADEEIFEMNNGCICCTVRGDLIRILGNLMKRKDKFDHILIETTGLADPGPVAQTFFVDDEMQKSLQLDGIVTVVDAKHVVEHLDSSDEVKEQIAFADVILLNKTDLVSPAQVQEVQAKIKQINGAAVIYHTKNSIIEMDKILGLGGFNLERALQVDPKFLEPEFPFEWSGIFKTSETKLALVCEKGPDPTMKVALMECEDSSAECFEKILLNAAVAFSSDGKTLKPSDVIEPSNTPYDLSFAESGNSRFTVSLGAGKDYAFFTQHLPSEFNLQLVGEEGPVLFTATHEYSPDHEHDSEITSVGLEFNRDMDAEKLQEWLSKLLREKGNDIFRMKGVFSVAHEERRLAFQGVHMLLDAERLDPWGDRKRSSKLIFIGRNLDRQELTESLERCFA
jgi:G3E family GTPase